MRLETRQAGAFCGSLPDAAGLEWKQHLHGRIERVPSREAAPAEKRKADVFEPQSQLRVLSPEEAADVFGGRFAGDVPQHVQHPAMEAVAPLIVETWSRVTPRHTAC